MKKYIGLLTLLATVVITFVSGCGTDKGNVITIGADYTLSGGLSFWSTELKK